jgi:hypothetical protein
MNRKARKGRDPDMGIDYLELINRSPKSFWVYQGTTFLVVPKEAQQSSEP